MAPLCKFFSLPIPLLTIRVTSQWFPCSNESPYLCSSGSFFLYFPSFIKKFLLFLRVRWKDSSAKMGVGWAITTTQRYKTRPLPELFFFFFKVKFKHLEADLFDLYQTAGLTVWCS